MNNASGCVSAIVVALIIGIACIGGCFGIFNKHIFGNKQYFDFKQSFNVAYVQMPDGTAQKIRVSKWKDYDNSDSIQIVDENGRAYYTHLNRVILTNE